MKKLEELLEWGGMKRDILFLAVSGIALLISIFDLLPLPFDAAWIAIIFCGIPIVLEAVIGLVTAFDIKADVLVSIALIASVLIGEDFAAGEVAFIMQLGGLLEETDLVVTGEGRMDWQSAFGKVPGGVAKRAKARGIPVAALVGGMGPGCERLAEFGIGSILPTVPGPMELEEALNRAEELYYDAALRMFGLLRAGWEMCQKKR